MPGRDQSINNIRLHTTTPLYDAGSALNDDELELSDEGSDNETGEALDVMSAYVNAATMNDLQVAEAMCLPE